MLWLWCRLEAVAPLEQVAQELPYVLGVALKTQKKTKQMTSLVPSPPLPWGRGVQVWQSRKRKQGAMKEPLNWVMLGRGRLGIFLLFKVEAVLGPI